MNRIFLDPIFRGAYPADLLEDVRHLGLEDHIMDGDLEVISTPIDVLGVNYYNGEAIGHEPPAAALDDSLNGGRADPLALPRRRRLAPPPARPARHRRWTGRSSPRA